VKPLMPSANSAAHAGHSQTFNDSNLFDPPNGTCRRTRNVATATAPTSRSTRPAVISLGHG